ncbi:MAG TPA: hypothetical protein VGR06_08245 [Actinophytocola sp.]|jgi:hypothetical protein|uniref:hypothetical protein n=1 Tax=Actinophytocola sp. TaxID=1872138 RepID=UPI002DFBDF92|nr:hypothetical protein [Actinophytocola sp.]
MRKIFAVPVVVLSLGLGLVAPAAAAPTRVIVLPGATSAEAITAAGGGTFYAADVLGGDIYRGDVRRGTAELFIDVPAGFQTVGMDLDARHGLLFVAGGPVFAGGQGKAYVYSTRTRALVASYDLGNPRTSLINDVTLTPDGAWFTDSLQPRLYFVPVIHGVPGPVRTLELSGPAAGPLGDFFINDITSTPSGRTLLVAPVTGQLCTINPVTGESAVVDKVDVAGADGLVLEGRRLWAVHFNNRITRWRLSDDLSRGWPDGEITDPNFAAPLAAAKFGNRLAVVNSHLDTGTSPTYEVVVVDA